MDNYLFNYEIKDWQTWGNVFCSKKEFTPLIRKIFENEKLVFKTIKNCKPGTNGVFQVGEYLIKLFVPIESGYDSMTDYQTEVYAMSRANQLGISVPRLIRKGAINDRYMFRYLIMDFIKGKTLGDVKDTLNRQEKIKIGKELQNIVTLWSTRCDEFNEIDVIKRTLNSKRWQGAPKELKDEQIIYLESLKNEQFVYVHGDLTEDNLLVDKDLNLSIIDFADSLCAPSIYEAMPIISDAFSFNMDFLEGYYGHNNVHEISEMCVNSMLCHQYGHESIKELIGSVNNITELKAKIKLKLTT